MSDTLQKYRDYMMTGFVKSVAPIVIEKASGAVVTDVNGREYLDCFAGISVVNAGHCNPWVIAAAKAQMDKLILRLGRGHDPRVAVSGIHHRNPTDRVPDSRPLSICDDGSAGFLDHDRRNRLFEAGHHIVAVFLDGVRHHRFCG